MKLKKLKYLDIFFGFAVGVVTWNILKALWKADWNLVGLWCEYHGGTVLLILSLLYLFFYVLIVSDFGQWMMRHPGKK
jgi:hypothetical protein